MKKIGKPFDPRNLGRDSEWVKNIASEQELLSDKMNQYCTPVTVCPVCDSGNRQVFTVVYDYNYYECLGCGHVYCGQILDSSLLQGLYDGESDNKTQQNKIYLDPGVFEKRVESIAREKVEFISQATHNHIPKTRPVWVDIGCGAGEMLYSARKKGWEVRGIESDMEEVAFVRGLGIDVDTAYLNKENCKALLSGVSMVSAINVLEHIADPVGFLKMISQATDELVVAFEVPRHPSLSSLSSKLFPRIAYRHIYPPDHLHIFTDSSIALLLKEAGLSMVGSWSFGQDAFNFFQAAGVASEAHDNEFWNKILDMCPAFQEVVDHNNLSDSILVVAKKCAESY